MISMRMGMASFCFWVVSACLTLLLFNTSLSNLFLLKFISDFNLCNQITVDEVYVFFNAKKTRSFSQLYFSKSILPLF